MNTESQKQILARGEFSLVELTGNRKLLISSGPLSFLLKPEEYLDLCGTLVHGLRIYKDIHKSGTG